MKKGSLSSEIREVMLSNPKLLKQRSNQWIKDGWLERHKGKGLPANFDSVMANVKSNMKSRKKQRKAKQAMDPNGTEKVAVSSDRKLSLLEDQIDDCMIMARNLHRTDLDEVVRFLKRARNKVVLTAGE